MDIYSNLVKNLPEYREIVRGCQEKEFPMSINGVFSSQKAHLLYSLILETKNKILYIAPNDIEAKKLYTDMTFFLKEQVVLYSAKEILLYDIVARSNESLYDRIISLDKIVNEKFKVIVTSIEAVSQRIIEKEVFKKNIIEIASSDVVEISELSQNLFELGYERENLIEGKGQFSIRGGIMDIFPINEENPVRIELFGDEVDSLRTFDISSQRSIEQIQNIRILPAKDVFYTQELKKKIFEDMEIEKEELVKKYKKKNLKIYDDIERAKNDYLYSISDKFTPFIISKSLIDYITDDVLICIDELNLLEKKYENIIFEHTEIFNNFFEKGYLLPNSYNVFFSKEEIIKKINLNATIFLSAFPQKDVGFKKKISVKAKHTASYNGHVELFIEDLKNWKNERNKIIVLAGTEGRAERLKEILYLNDLDPVYSENITKEVEEGQIVITKGALNTGFEYPSIKLVIISDREISGSERRPKSRHSKKNRKAISAFTDLKIGDLVVHQSHGIGKYIGIQQLVVNNTKKDYLKIQYQSESFLYIPTNQLDLIQKYIGSDGRAPKLNKLGGSEWIKLKSKVKESVKKLAKGLINLYAKREAIKGYSFLPDTVWQRQFEDMFPYQETEDQLRSIEEIKRDMEAQKPMDRLLCGDVGFGKTEVALRAIFKACMSGKQVAYLVPTTVLAQQHYNNFIERMKDFPIKIDVISRCRTPKEQKKILKGIKAGAIDVLIGTHRILQKDVIFKDLGLLVVDEEQRFGVAHKERIKNINTTIDVLTLSATPIPRTLHMSLSGIRDISTLEEPPQERYPVQTYVIEYDKELIRDAIIREISRSGQIFYLYNKVRTIELKAMELQNLLPDARIAVAHGQMNEGDLEDIILDFIDKKYDILVCTTIIESGVDMPNVNTIIVEEADRMGLAQLYQLRGRVGRSNKLGYAYITYKKDKVLKEVPQKRLQAIKEFTEFGSGFKIAMRDMEIRGAGNLIGAEQHGHMEAVGYEMYTKMLESAIKEEKGEISQIEYSEITIDIDISAYIDNSYIQDQEQKMEMYKKIALIQDNDDVLDICDELMDRFGDLPQEVENLIQIAELKYLAKASEVELIKEKEQSIIIQFKENKKINFELLGKIIEQHPKKILFTANNKPYLTYKIRDLARKEVLLNIKKILQNLNKT